MTVRTLTHRIQAIQRLPAGRVLWPAAFVLTSVIAGRLVTDPAFTRGIFALGFLAVVVGIGVRAPKPVLLGLVGWLAALGLTRRLLSGISPGGAADPLLLIGPVALIILTTAAMDRGAFRRHSALSRAVLVFSVLTMMGALNPLQGSIVAGATGIIFFVPLLAFWIGRGLVDDRTLTRLLWVVAATAIPAALYGMRQTFVGFPGWDQAWIDSTGYTALAVGEATRPFSSFSSAAEYATFLAVAIVAWLRLGMHGIMRLIAAAAAALLIVAVVYQSSRGTIVMLVAAVALTVGARRRLPLAGSFALGSVLILLLPPLVSRFAPAEFDKSGPSQLLAHQVEGLANPLDPNASTAGAHFSLLVNGLGSAFREPLGHGISAVTIAGSKFGGIKYGTETDPSNAAVALGLPGLLAYLAILGLGFTTVYRLAARSGDRLPIAALGIVTVTLFQWLNGGQYAVTFLPWLLLGWADRRWSERGVAEPEAEPLAPPAPILGRAVDPPLRLGPTPVRRSWNIFTLSRLAVAAAGVDPERDDERRYLLLHLREFTPSSGMLRPEFDELVRESFGELIERDGRA